MRGPLCYTVGMEIRDRRDRVVRARVSSSEYERIASAAQAQSLTVGSYVRMIMLQGRR